MTPQQPVATILIIIAMGYTTYRGFKDPAFHEQWVFSSHYIWRRGQYYRLLSSAFLHVGWPHFIMNMVALYICGSYLELRPNFGPLALIMMLLTCVAGGSLLSLHLHRLDDYWAVGASGGVAGLIYALVMLEPKAQFILFPIPIPLPAWLFAILYFVATFWRIKVGTERIGHEAHLGGAISGLLLIALREPDVIRENPLLFFTLLLLTVGALLFFNRMTPFFSFSRKSRRIKTSRKKADRPEIILNNKASEQCDFIAFPKSTPGPAPWDDDEMCDALLDKIARQGIQSLTSSERKLLERISERKRKQKPKP